MTCTKISILLQMLRFFFQPSHRRAIKAFIVFVILYGVSTIFVTLLSCKPFAFAWNRLIDGGTCTYSLWYAHAGLGMLSDVCICILPIPMLRSLQLPKMHKYGLMFIFATGGL